MPTFTVHATVIVPVSTTVEASSEAEAIRKALEPRQWGNGYGTLLEPCECELMPESMFAVADE